MACPSWTTSCSGSLAVRTVSTAFSLGPRPAIHRLLQLLGLWTELRLGGGRRRGRRRRRRSLRFCFDFGRGAGVFPPQPPMMRVAPKAADQPTSLRMIFRFLLHPRGERGRSSASTNVEEFLLGRAKRNGDSLSPSSVREVIVAGRRSQFQRDPFGQPFKCFECDRRPVTGGFQGEFWRQE